MESARDRPFLIDLRTIGPLISETRPLWSIVKDFGPDPFARPGARSPGIAAQVEQGEDLSVGTQRPQAFRVAILSRGGDGGHDEQGANQASKPKDQGPWRGSL